MAATGSFAPWSMPFGITAGSRHRFEGSDPAGVDCSEIRRNLALLEIFELAPDRLEFLFNAGKRPGRG